MFQTYSNFKSHEHNFNTFFSTSVACVVSLLIGGLLAPTNFFNSTNSWFVFLLLVVFPMIVFVAVAGEAEFRTAYYKTWQDKITGKIDQSKILKRFAKQYKIKNWRVKVDQIDADGRWNFRADTNYMHRLTEQRDLLLSEAYEEYIDLIKRQDSVIIEAKRVLSNMYVELEAAKGAKAIVKGYLDDAKSSGEKYKQRRDYDQKVVAHSLSAEAKIDAEYQLEEAEKEKKTIFDNYKNTVYQIKTIFYGRYSRYTEYAIKKINKINGLKYTIIDMPSTESWLNNENRKEIK